VIENEGLRIFGLKRDKMSGTWTKFGNEKFHKFTLLAKYNDNDQVRKDAMGRTCRTNEEEKEYIRYLWQTRRKETTN
jgi:hypothetical protein